jgi:uncharacterized iron-regulated membrane protein
MATKNKFIDTVHKWIGLLALVFLLLQALTGALIVDNERTMQWIDGDTYMLEKPFSGTIDIAKISEIAAAKPDETLASIILPFDQSFPVLAIVVPKQRAMPSLLVIDPESNKIRTRKPLFSNITVIANAYHEQMFSGKAGQFVLMIIGIMLVTLSITGLLRWWPGRHKFWTVMRLRWAGSVSSTLWQWHTALGALLAIFFIWLGATGALLVGRTFLEPAVGTFASVQPMNAEPNPPAAGTEPVDSIGLQGAARQVQELLPKNKIVAVVPLSRLSDRHIIVTMDPLQRKAITRVAGDGTITENYVPTDAPGASRSFDWMLPLHRGSMLPESIRYLYYFFAIGLILISVAGFTINRKKAGLRKKKTN